MMKTIFKITGNRGGAPADPQSGRDDVLKKIIFYGLLSLLVFTPLPAASVNEWSILIIELTVLVMTGCYLFLRQKPVIGAGLASHLRWLKYALVGIFGLIGLQIIPLPKAVVKILSPHTYEFHSLYAPFFEKSRFTSISVVPSQTFVQGLELLTYVLAGFLVLRCISRWRLIRTIIYVLVALGFFEAFYGIYELSTKNPRVLFYKKVYSLGSVTGSFINRNHLAGYLEMILPLAIGLVLARIDFFSLAGMTLREKILHVAGKGLMTNVLLTLAAVVMSVGIVLSRSRSGTFLLVFIFILFAEFIVLHRGRYRFRRLWIRNFITVTFLLVTVISLYIGIGATVERFSLDNLLHEGRPAYWSNVLRIIGDFPLWGSGLGTFASVYAAYEKTGSAELRLVHAHNDYLEYFSELGVPGGILFFGAVFYMIIVSFKAWKDRQNSGVKGIVLGGMISAIVILIHGLTDFNLHIPAIMFLFAVVLSLTMAAAYYRKT